MDNYSEHDFVGSLEKGVPAQVSSSTSDQATKLRDPSQNRSRVASKRVVNIAKLKQWRSCNFCLPGGTCSMPPFLYNWVHKPQNTRNKLQEK
ncbi:hypothetical protein AVEN_127441-1 [Araneus ventricosus]|uniref:Uncharacterized protein n=1 Tax=Araneus ventricosus TaxID=182803 RepID=A0A4Y2EUK6_ARAVE|nr:hypothetical protein AVEN_127441-1 [Araneus ventricosus]